MDQHKTTVPTIALLLTTFNRREFTLACLRRIREQQQSEPRVLSVFLVDDASKDGTVDAVRAEFPDTHIQVGDGHLFWVRGMRKAFAAAMERGFDYYLWLNDDTMLVPDALDTMLRTSHTLEARNIKAIVAASISMHGKMERSYGGFKQVSTLGSKKLIAVDPSPDEMISCDTFNGNCVLIPNEIARRLENMEGRFQHCMADLDYGLRAKNAGFQVYLPPRFLAHCNDNPSRGTWRDTAAPFRVRWKHLNSPKGVPMPEWSLFCRRHRGILWPLVAISPYVKTVVTSIWKAK